MAEAIIALGTNVGDREGNLRRAVGMIGRKAKLARMSSVYETEPMYYENQRPFLNCVVVIETDLTPRALLCELQTAETEMGRQRTVKYGPRIIDLDILFYGDEVISEPGLEVPHPKITERPFVLVPLREVRPDLVHPVLGKSVSRLIDELETSKQVLKRSDFDLASSLSPQRP